MLTYFCKKKRGSITILLSVILIAVLSLNSTFLEIARFKSLERFYKELEDNAAFSVLSKYDRSLLSNFGLLGLQNEAGEADLIKYLKDNMSDQSLELLEDELKLDKLYDLSQKEVLAMQINEFCAYRAPASMLNNALNLEGMFKDLVKDLESALPFFTLFDDLSKSFQTVIDAFIQLDKYEESGEKLKEANEQYIEKLNNLNSAISQRDDYRSEHFADEKGYADTMAGLNNSVAEAAADVQEKIVDVKKAVGEYQTEWESLVKKFNAMQAANIKSLLTAAEMDADDIQDEDYCKNYKDMIKEMRTSYDNSESLVGKVAKAMNEDRMNKVLVAQDHLTEQAHVLSGKAEDLQSQEVVDVGSQSQLWDAIALSINALAQLETIVDSWSKLISSLGELLDVLQLAYTKGKYELKYNNVLDAGFRAGLSGNSEGKDEMTHVNNPFLEMDERAVKEQIAVASKTAQQVGFDTDSLYVNGGPSGYYALQTAMGKLFDSTSSFRDACTKLTTSFWFLDKLAALRDTLSSLIDLLGNIINVIRVFSEVGVPQLIQTILYQKVNPAVYANEMFSNRVSAGKRMNGSFMPDYSGYTIGNRYFKQANVEYILFGSDSEYTNQTNAFLLIMVLRMLCNIPALLGDETLMEIVTECAGTFVGIIVAIIIILVLLLVEAWSDMIFMLYSDGKVDFIKTKGYFSLDGSGLEDFGEKVKGMATNLVKVIDENDEKDKEESNGENGAGSGKEDDENSTKEKDSSGFSIEWTYKDHLFATLILFVPNERMYARIANLIEMQMKQEYRKKGSMEDFSLRNRATYIRVESTAQYIPLLPIPSIPGLNDTGLKIKSIHYSGY